MLRVVGEKFTFFKSFVTAKLSRGLRLSDTDVVLLINFPEQFELCFCSRSYKVL